MKKNKIKTLIKILENLKEDGVLCVDTRKKLRSVLKVVGFDEGTEERFDYTMSLLEYIFNKDYKRGYRAGFSDGYDSGQDDGYYY